MATALITGASGGIGEACVYALSEIYDIAAHYYSSENRINEVAGDASITTKNDIISYQADIANPSEVTSMIERINNDLGSIDVLVNNAGVGTSESIDKTTPEEINRKISINLFGAMYCTQAVLPDMLEKKSGRIISVASSAGIHGSRVDPTYGASKGGLIAFSKSLARAYTANGVFSNVVAPGPTDTQMYSEERKPIAKRNIRIGRLMRPCEIAAAVEFFATTTSISGKTLEIDGGRDI